MNDKVSASFGSNLSRSPNWRNALLLLLLYAALWLVLSGNDGWLFGACFVIAATLLSLHLGLNLAVVRFTKLPAFVFAYLSELMVAAWQVAYTACRRNMPINPRWVSFTLTSRYTRTQLLLASVICLLPGTLASRVRGEQMHIHLLNAEQPWRPTVARMEVRLMALLGEND